jgi:flagellar motor switch protein FliG
MEEFHSTAVAAEYVTRGDVEFARRVLVRTIGQDNARRIIDRVQRSFQSTAGFTSLEKADPQQLSKFILGEHPQTIALILAHLHASSAAQLIALLPESLRVDVLTRMASLEDISPDVVSRISSVIEQRLKTLGGPSREQHGGVRAVAELFNRLERTISASALEAIEARKPELALSIRNLMFVFEDLLHVDDNGMRELVSRADKKALTIALKGSSEEIRERFLKNMSKRAGEMLREEMEVLGAVRLREVEKAQQEVVAVARKLEEEGIIVTGAAAGEAYVV